MAARGGGPGRSQQTGQSRLARRAEQHEQIFVARHKVVGISGDRRAQYGEIVGVATFPGMLSQERVDLPNASRGAP